MAKHAPQSGSPSAPPAGRKPHANREGLSLAQAADAYLQAHSAEKFSLQAVAGALYVNGCYLLRVYKAETGSPLLQAHNRIRCDRARVLLAQPEISISRVGEMVGFVTPSHFTRIFRKVTGVTPTEYRRRLLRGAEEGEA